MHNLAKTLAASTLATLLASCQAPAGSDAAPATDGAATGDASPSASAAQSKVIDSGSQPTFDAIGANETLRFVGTEPFWGGTVEGGAMLYSTPENEDGEEIAVRRFAGNNGLGFSGTRAGVPIDLTITPGTCSDGMSDRSYPFTATLKLGEEQRNGCAWTDRKPFTGPENP